MDPAEVRKWPWPRVVYEYEHLQELGRVQNENLPDATQSVPSEVAKHAKNSNNPASKLYSSHSNPKVTSGVAKHNTVIST